MAQKQIGVERSLHQAPLSFISPHRFLRCATLISSKKVKIWPVVTVPDPASWLNLPSTVRHVVPFPLQTPQRSSSAPDPILRSQPTSWCIQDISKIKLEAMIIKNSTQGQCAACERRWAFCWYFTPSWNTCEIFVCGVNSWNSSPLLGKEEGNNFFSNFLPLHSSCCLHQQVLEN